MKGAVIDTSVLAAFSGIGRIDLLWAVFPEIAIVPGVFREIVTDGSGWREAGAAQGAIREGRFQVVDVVECAVVPGIGHLGAGEREVIAWALHRGVAALIDDAPARRAAVRAGVSEIVGSLGILGRAKWAGVIAQVSPLLGEMRGNGIRFGDELVHEFLVTMNER